ncbi:MAG: hypothetical protein JOY71_10365 [Acetobacteraceae bacterium]|nr:hypothetical protein [Acetobacteraceae bacterium]MBV8522506.1 hypothetical protein [Acetobacteraceae bacterium]MBV8589721.1 hypothetical protein [Acetobacteraceae bacterium]
MAAFGDGVSVGVSIQFRAMAEARSGLFWWSPDKISSEDSLGELPQPPDAALTLTGPPKSAKGLLWFRTGSSLGTSSHESALINM